MIRNYIKIAVRTLWRSKGYALINTIGLAIGITGATLLMTYVKDETSFDKFHSKSDQIVRGLLIQHNADGDRIYSANQPVLAKTLVDVMPEVEEVTVVQQTGGHVDFTIDGVRYSERQYFIADSSFFDVFDFEMIMGDPDKALSEPNSVVLTERQAIKFFGKTDVIGEILRESFMGDQKITGIVKSPPTNSHLQFDVILSRINSPQFEQSQTSWNNFNASAYYVLAEGTNLDELKIKINELFDQRVGDRLAEVLDCDLQKLHDIHFNSENIEAGFESSLGDGSYIIIFSSIAVFLLLIAAVNYMNLATSKAVFRAKEIGIRKVVGAVKRQLIFQFLTESILITFLATLISIGLTDLIMPFFNQLTGKEFEFSRTTLVQYLPLFLIIAISVGALSGIYPSFFMTRFKPVDVLKGEQKIAGSFSIRKFLVILQFGISILLIIITLIVGDQMNYVKERDLGFNEEDLLVIDINNSNVRRNFRAMRTQFAQIPGVQSVGVSSRVPGEWKNITQLGMRVLGEDGAVRDSADVYFMGFDTGMIETFDFRLIDGGAFSGNESSDSLKVLLNETAVESFGLGQAVGKTVQLRTRHGIQTVQVVGVLKDFNFQSLHAEISPIVIGAWNNRAASIDYFTLKVSGNIPRIIEGATAVHEAFDQSTAMEYHFLESQLELFYEKEREASAIFRAGAGLSIFVACLGLFGLASFTVQKRIKELGIRKVLGASQWNLFYLLSSSFTKQVLLAFLVASPFGFLIMKNWLERFVYRVDITVGVFLISGLAAILIALLTVSYRSLKAANSNPVTSLRRE